MAPDDCKQPGIRKYGIARGWKNEDIYQCECSVLGMVDQASTTRNGFNRCQPSMGAPTIELTFARPRDILSVSFLIAPRFSSEYNTTFTYQIQESHDSQTVTIPPGSEGWGALSYGTSIVDIHNNCKLPQNVEKVMVQLGTNAGFKGMRVCKASVSLVGDPQVRTQHQALQFQATSSIIGKVQYFQCPHGQEEYTFSEWIEGPARLGSTIRSSPMPRWFAGGRATTNRDLHTGEPRRRGQRPGRARQPKRRRRHRRA